MQKVRTRSGHEKREPYPLNEFTPEFIEELGKRLIHRKAIGQPDISGDDFCHIFAEAIGGESLDRPIGIADVTWENCCWSVKTVKNGDPHQFTVRKKNQDEPKRIRLISGRNSPSYSAGISDPFTDIQATGKAVLNIYNSRINEARGQYSDMRLLVFLRNMQSQKFTIFERPINEYAVGDYKWRRNKENNLEGRNGAGEHVFTWQPHGSQFTIILPIPIKATRFHITQKIPQIPMENVLEAVKYESDWIQILPDWQEEIDLSDLL